MNPVGLEVEPQLLGDDAGLVVDLDFERAPAVQVRVVERRGIAGDHHLAGQRLQDAQKLDMVVVRAVEAVAALRPARRLHIGRVAVDQFAALERERLQKAQGAVMVELDRVVASEAVDRPAVEVDADVTDRRRLALHDGAAAQERFDVHVMRGHGAHEDLAEPRRRLGSVPCRHRRLRRDLPRRQVNRTGGLCCQTKIRP